MERPGTGSLAQYLPCMVALGDLPPDWLTRAYRTSDPFEAANWLSRLGLELEPGSQADELHVASDKHERAYVLITGEIVVRRGSPLDTILGELARRAK